MKIKICFILLLFSFGYAKAQLLTGYPNFITDTSSRVDIVLDATLGNKGLINYSNPSDIYVHIGVITSESSSPSDWKYTKFNWGANNAESKASYIGSNKWVYAIVGGLRSYFGITNTSEKILKIAILFRDGTGTTVHRNADESDMYLTIYQQGLQVKIFNPFNEPEFVSSPLAIEKSIGENITIIARSSEISSLKLYLNGSQVGFTNLDSTITATPTLKSYGKHMIVAEAVTANETKYDTVFFNVAPRGNGLIIAAGAEWVCIDTAKLVLQDIDQLINSGIFTPGRSTVIVNSKIFPTSIGSAYGTSLSFFNLKINVIQNVRLAQNIGITKKITFQNGNLNVQNYTIQMNSGSVILYESENARLMDDVGNTGQVVITKNVLRSAIQNPGNLGVEFLPGSSGFGDIKVTRFCANAPASNTFKSIGRYYGLTKINPGNVTMRFYYLNAELNGVFPSNAMLYHSVDNGVTWTSFFPSVIDTITKYLQVNLITDINGLWAIGNPLGAKPTMVQQEKGKWLDKEDKIFSLLTVYPNPAHGRLFVRLNSKCEGAAHLEIYSAAGNLLRHTQLNLKKGENDFPISTIGLNPGIYTLVLHNHLLKMTAKTIIQ